MPPGGRNRAATGQKPVPKALVDRGFCRFAVVDSCRYTGRRHRSAWLAGMVGRRQVVRHWILIPAFGGSIPPAPASSNFGTARRDPRPLACARGVTRSCGSTGPARALARAARHPSGPSQPKFRQPLGGIPRLGFRSGRSSFYQVHRTCSSRCAEPRLTPEQLREDYFRGWSGCGLFFPRTPSKVRPWLELIRKRCVWARGIRVRGTSWLPIVWCC